MFEGEEDSHELVNSPTWPYAEKKTVMLITAHSYITLSQATPDSYEMVKNLGVAWEVTDLSCARGTKVYCS